MRRISKIWSEEEVYRIVTYRYCDGKPKKSRQHVSLPSKYTVMIDVMSQDLGITKAQCIARIYDDFFGYENVMAVEQKLKEY